MKRSFLILFCCLVFSVSAFSQEAEKLQEYEEVPCDQHLAIMDSAISAAETNPSSTVYFLIYEGKERKYDARKNKTRLVLPNVGSAEAKIKSIKSYLSLRNVPADRFLFVEAGFRENLSVEIWLVPTGATPPKPTPTLTKIKYRKGKASGFCIYCCG